MFIYLLNNHHLNLSKAAGIVITNKKGDLTGQCMSLIGITTKKKARRKRVLEIDIDS